jgi:protein-glutamine gamma-glutamyltransferase
MARDPDRPARRVTFVLAGLAYLTCEVAADPDGRLTPFGVGFGLTLFAAAVVASYLLPPPRNRLPFKVTALLALALVLPVALDPVVREWTDAGLPLELQLVNGLRALGLGLAAAAAWPKCRRLAAVVALFLALFATAMGDQPAIPYLLAALAATGGVWLVLNYRADLAGATATAEAVVERVRARFPVREAVVFGALALLTIGAIVAGPSEVVGHLGELVPTSGGTGSQDPFARYGTNDGPEETRGDNANSVGMVESDQFIESQQDTLLDLVGDMYGKGHKPRKDQERMVAGGQVRVKENHDKLPENKRPSRDFDTSREGPKSARKGDSRAARAVFEVEGRTPLHIAAVAYDRYDVDNRRWLQAPAPKALRLEADPAGDDWMILAARRPGGDWYAADDRHELKVADQKDRLVPTPALTARFRIRKVDRPDYYEWDYDGVLGLAGRRRTPTGVIVHTDCRTVIPERLAAGAFATNGFSPTHLDVPGELRETVGRLAREWAADSPRGWPQVEAVLNRLRAEYTFDQTAAAPEDHPVPVMWFLSESRRGPDYLFATAAALALRSLGYPTRVCLGYYANPAAYDPVSQHTPVRPTDLHTWPEVLLRDGHWLVVEPTPGYGVLPPKKPWREHLADTIEAAAAWAGDHAAELGLGVIALGVLVWRRRRLADGLFTVGWRIAPGRTWRSVVTRAARVLDCRARLAGCPRPRTETLTAWAARLQPDDAALQKFLRLTDWARFADPWTQPDEAGESKTVCRRVLDEWTFGRIAGLARGEG